MEGTVLPFEPLPNGKYYVLPYTGTARLDRADDYFSLFKVDGEGQKINDQFWDPNATQAKGYEKYNDEKRSKGKKIGRWRDALRFTAVNRDTTSHGCIVCVPGEGKDEKQVLSDWDKIKKWIRNADGRKFHTYKNNEIPRLSDPVPKTLTKYAELTVE